MAAERVLPGNDLRTLRVSLSTLGDGFIEAIDDRTIMDIAASQPAIMRGKVVDVVQFYSNLSPNQQPKILAFLNSL